MSQRKPDGTELDAELFDQGLIKEPLDALEQLIDELPQVLADMPLEFLLDCKRRVDARIDAEPNQEAFNMSDPHGRRLRCWVDIRDRLVAETNWQRSKPSKESSSTQGDKKSLRPGAEKQHPVSARRTIVKQNPGIPGKELCEILDRESIRLPKRWAEAGFKTWVEAWREREQQIQVIFSKDRRSS
jgi:hypothetical protein